MKYMVFFIKIAVFLCSTFQDYVIHLDLDKKNINVSDQIHSENILNKEIGYFDNSEYSNFNNKLFDGDYLNSMIFNKSHIFPDFNIEKNNFRDLSKNFEMNGKNKIANFQHDIDIFEIFKKLEELCKFEDETKIHKCVMFLLSIFDFLSTNTNVNLIYDYLINDEICQNGLYSILDNDYKNLSLLLTLSGKSLQDYGLEDECEAQGFNYYLIKIELSKINLLQDEVLMFINEFLGLNNFSVGFCFIKNCDSYVQQFFNSTANSQFYDFIRKKGIIDINLFSNKKEEYSTVFIYFFGYFFSFYLLFKLICTSFGLFSNKKYGGSDISHFYKNSIHSGLLDEYNIESSRQRENDFNLSYKKKEKFKNKIFQYSFFSQNENNNSMNNLFYQGEKYDNDNILEFDTQNFKKKNFKK